MRSIRFVAFPVLMAMMLIAAPKVQAFHPEKSFEDAVREADLLVRGRVVAIDTLTLSESVIFEMDTIEVERVLLNRRQENSRIKVRPDAFDRINDLKDDPPRIAVVRLAREGSTWFTAKPLELHKVYHFPLAETSLSPAGIYQLIDHNTPLPGRFGETEKDFDRSTTERVEERIERWMDATDDAGESVEFTMIDDTFEDAAARFEAVGNTMRRFAAQTGAEMVQAMEEENRGYSVAEVFGEGKSYRTFSELLGEPRAVLAVTIDGAIPLEFADGSTYPLVLRDYVAFPDSPFRRRMQGVVDRDAEVEHQANGLRFYRTRMTFNDYREFDVIAVRGPVQTTRGPIPLTVYLPVRELAATP